MWHGCAELALAGTDADVVEGRFGLLGCRAHAANGRCTCSTSNLPQPSLLTAYLSLWHSSLCIACLKAA